MLGKELHPKREGLEVVYRAYGQIEAEVVKGRLEASGIPAALDGEAAGQLFGITVTDLGEIRILVPTERAEEARELLKAEAGDEVGDDEEISDSEEDKPQLQPPGGRV